MMMMWYWVWDVTSMYINMTWHKKLWMCSLIVLTAAWRAVVVFRPSSGSRCWCQCQMITSPDTRQRSTAVSRGLRVTNYNKPFIDWNQTPPQCRNAASAIRPNVTSPIKPEVHNVAQRRWRTTEPRPQRICVQNFVTIGPAVSEMCSRTDKHTDRQTKWLKYSTPERSNNQLREQQRW